MEKSQDFEFYTELGNTGKGVDLPKSKNPKINNAISYLNKAGILMEGHACLKLSPTSYIVILEDKKTELFQLLNSQLGTILDISTTNVVDIREIVSETMLELKIWVKEDKISRRLLGQTVIMQKVCQDFDREIFESVIRNNLSLTQFMSVLELGHGVFDQGNIDAAKLPDYFLDSLKELTAYENDMLSGS